MKPSEPWLTGFFTTTLVLIGTWMLATWIRLFMPFGQGLGPDYEPWTLLATLVLGVAVLFANGLAYVALFFPQIKRFYSPRRQLRVFLISLFSMMLMLLVFAPDMSRLQVAYMLPTGIFIGILVIFLPSRLRQNAYLKLNILDNLRELWQKRELIVLWLIYRIEARYTQTVLGILWIILLPLSTSLVLAFAFGQLLGSGQLASGVSTVSFLLAGIVIFGIFRDMVLKARSSLLGSMSIIGRVYFPREIIVVLLVGEVLIDFFFVFIAMIVINLSQGLYPGINYLLIPIPVVILLIFSTGLSLISAWFGMIIRDLQQLLTVLVQLLFYVTVLYSPERASPTYEPFVQLIPVTQVIVAFRDIVLYNRSPDFYSLFYPFVLGVVLLYFGYVYFKVNEDRFVDLA
jgi:lipopolysaccharide transport system permease protein